jgi:hypothetical protein
MARNRTLLAALGLLALLPAGCGETKALTKEQYVSKVNAMCESFSAREKEIGEPRTLADLVEKGPRVLDAFEQTILDTVHSLEPPTEVAGQNDRLVELAEQQRDVLAGLVDAAKASDVARVQELSATNASVNTEAAAVARRLGAESCV